MTDWAETLEGLAAGQLAATKNTGPPHSSRGTQRECCVDRLNRRGLSDVGASQLLSPILEEFGLQELAAARA